MKKVQMRFNDLTRSQKDDLIEDLNNSANMEEFLFIIISEFDLAKCSPGTITKGMLSQQMIRIVLPMINPIYKNYE